MLNSLSFVVKFRFDTGKNELSEVDILIFKNDLMSYVRIFPTYSQHARGEHKKKRERKKTKKRKGNMKKRNMKEHSQCQRSLAGIVFSRINEKLDRSEVFEL